jgi:hypothetical protein
MKLRWSQRRCRERKVRARSIESSRGDSIIVFGLIVPPSPVTLFYEIFAFLAIASHSDVSRLRSIVSSGKNSRGSPRRSAVLSARMTGR